MTEVGSRRPEVGGFGLNRYGKQAYMIEQVLKSVGLIIYNWIFAFRNETGTQFF